MHLYFLKLQQDKYYIGKTNNIQIRIKDHFNQKGSSFTKLYKPIELLKIIENCDKYDEDKYVLKYMETYGIDNVRGGSYSNIFLYKHQILEITNKIKNANDCCFKCGEKGHFVKECTSNSESSNKNNDCCYRCGKKGHFISNCYEETNINGKRFLK